MKKRVALVTGGYGFVGKYLVKHLESIGYSVFKAGRNIDSNDPTSYKLDIRDKLMVSNLVNTLMPDEIYHLAAISHPVNDAIDEFYKINLLGTLNVIESGVKTNSKILLISSAYVYGNQFSTVNETAKLRSLTHYGMSKYFTERISEIFSTIDNAKIIIARSFNHTGLGQNSNFFIPSLVEQVKDGLKRNKPTVTVQVGNLNSVRDYLDVRDVVDAYQKLVQAEKFGEVFNVCSGKGRSVLDIIKLIESIIDKRIEYESIELKKRANDIDFLVGDNSKLLTNTDWEIKIPLETTLKEMLQM